MAASQCARDLPDVDDGEAAGQGDGELDVAPVLQQPGDAGEPQHPGAPEHLEHGAYRSTVFTAERLHDENERARL